MAVLRIDYCVLFLMLCMALAGVCAAIKVILPIYFILSMWGYYMTAISHFMNSISIMKATINCMLVIKLELLRYYSLFLPPELLE